MVIITINKKITDKELQYKIKREAEKISALPSGKIGKYEYLTGEEIFTAFWSESSDTSYVYLFTTWQK